MNGSVFYFVAALVLMAANSKAHAQGIIGLFEDAASTPVSAARGLTETTVQAATRGADATASAGREAVYLTGDGTEFAYKHHPGARLGRKVGVLPQGKLGLLPSNDDLEPAPEAQPPETSNKEEGLDKTKSADTNRAESGSAQSVSRPRRAVRPRRSRSFVSRLFRFARR